MSVSVSGNMHIFGCSKAALAIFWVGLAKYGNLHNHACKLGTTTIVEILINRLTTYIKLKCFGSSF